MALLYPKLCKDWMEDLKDPLFLFLEGVKKDWHITYGVDKIEAEWIFFEFFIQSFFSLRL